MISILGRARIEALPRFMGMFSTDGAAMRRKHGSCSAQVFKVCAEEEEVVLLFQWRSREDFESFLSDPEVKAVMASSGTLGKPEFTFLEPVAVLPS